MKINKSHKKEICKYTHIAHLQGVISILYLGYVTNVSTGVLEQNVEVVLFRSPCSAGYSVHNSTTSL